MHIVQIQIPATTADYATAAASAPQGQLSDLSLDSPQDGALAPHRLHVAQLARNEKIAACYPRRPQRSSYHRLVMIALRTVKMDVAELAGRVRDRVSHGCLVAVEDPRTKPEGRHRAAADASAHERGRVGPWGGRRWRDGGSGRRRQRQLVLVRLARKLLHQATDSLAWLCVLEERRSGRGQIILCDGSLHVRTQPLHTVRIVEIGERGSTAHVPDGIKCHLDNPVDVSLPPLCLGRLQLFHLSVQHIERVQRSERKVGRPHKEARRRWCHGTYIIAVPRHC
mmetsp:Transcript_25266/g.50809  ORF Transcript_25266/g.50809 Transcript_25266/m.50809 type:complete len:282 (+) Transcript_25266:649-1494(+)